LFYYLTDRESQKDWGFGLVALSFKDAAYKLLKDREFISDITVQSHFPINYLLRHSAELYLKSMIVSLHKFLDLTVDDERYNIRFIGQNEKERQLNNTHWISELHWYWDKLINDYQDEIEKRTESNWARPPELKDVIETISKYDDSSTFFRYPVEKRPTTKDNNKFKTSQLIIDDLEGYVREGKTPYVLILEDEEGSITEAYGRTEFILEKLEKSLLIAVDYLHGFHAKTRFEFFGGF